MNQLEILPLKRNNTDPQHPSDVTKSKHGDKETDSENQNNGAIKKTTSLNTNEKQVSTKSPTKETTMAEKVLIWATNFSFKTTKEKFESKKDNELVILGKFFSPIQKKEIEIAIKDVIWFSYRYGFPSLLHDIFPKEKFTTDRGWGCMLRCGQMLFAESIKRHLKSHKIITSSNRVDMDFIIINFFCDSNLNFDQSPFSIQQISRVAYESFGIKPGQWYRASNIMGTLLKLNQKNTIKNLQNFKVVNFIDGCIFEDQIMKAAINNTSNDTNEILTHKEEGELKKEIKWDNSLLVFVASKTGLEKHNDIYLPSILKMMAFPESVGMLGGQNDKAYYFLGCQNSTLMYLDPHFAQQAVEDSGDLVKQLNTYYMSQFFELKIEDVDTSIGLGFYFKNEVEYAEFKGRLAQEISEDPNFLIGFEKETPSIEHLKFNIKEVNDMDGSFEIIE